MRWWPCKVEALSWLFSNAACCIILIMPSTGDELSFLHVQVTLSLGCMSCSHWKLMRQKTETNRKQKQKTSFIDEEKHWLIFSKLLSSLVCAVVTQCNFISCELKTFWYIPNFLCRNLWVVTSTTACQGDVLTCVCVLCYGWIYMNFGE